jgi:type IV secretory pathway TrbF-like protein
MARNWGMESNPYLEARREWDDRYVDLVLGERTSTGRVSACLRFSDREALMETKAVLTEIQNRL